MWLPKSQENCREQGKRAKRSSEHRLIYAFLNSGLVREEFQEACLRALEKCGLTAEGYAKLLCEGFKEPTGELRNSITHVVVVDENTVYIGTDSDHGSYVELGAGKYYPGGRPTPWTYQDAKENWHLTHGLEHFVKCNFFFMDASNLEMLPIDG